MLDSFIMLRDQERTSYLFSSFIPKASVSNIFITLSSRSSVCLAASPTGLI